MRTKEQCVESIRRLAPELYSFGKRVTDIGSHACFKPPLDAIGLVYELASRKEYADLLTAMSPFTGGKVSRFVHILIVKIWPGASGHRGIWCTGTAPASGPVA